MEGETGVEVRGQGGQRDTVNVEVRLCQLLCAFDKLVLSHVVNKWRDTSQLDV